MDQAALPVHKEQPLACSVAACARPYANDGHRSAPPWSCDSGDQTQFRRHHPPQHQSFRQHGAPCRRLPLPFSFRLPSPSTAHPNRIAVRSGHLIKPTTPAGTMREAGSIPDASLKRRVMVLIVPWNSLSVDDVQASPSPLSHNVPARWELGDLTLEPEDRVVDGQRLFFLIQLPFLALEGVKPSGQPRFLVN